MLDARLPEPELNATIYDARGLFLGMVDFCFRQYRVVVEYQGDYRRTQPGRYRDDINLRPVETLRRIANKLHAHGWAGTLR